MDTRDWHILWGVPPKYDNESNKKNRLLLLQPALFSASTLDVILQRLMPLYRLRQTGESMTLLPSATHIDIAAAMALWILGWHILWGVPPKYDNESNKKNRLLITATGTCSQKLG